MRAVMSGASVNARPRRNASKKRGGSYMRSCTSATMPPSMRTYIAPSPSTRASASTLIVRLMGLARLAERRRAGVECAVDAHQVSIGKPQLLQPRGQSRRVGGLHRPEAAVAAAVVGRAQRTAAGVRDRTEARCAVGDHDADGVAALALDADAVRPH